MITIKEILESNQVVKSLAIIAFKMPFWYVALFVCNKEFITNANSITIACFCFVLSSLSSILPRFLFDKYFDEKDTNNDFLSITMGIIVVLTALFLSLLIFIFHVINLVLIEADYKIIPHEFSIFVISFYIIIIVFRVYLTNKK